jgi:hypothetical protein
MVCSSLCYSICGFNAMVMSFSLGFVHGLRSLPLSKEWVDKDYVLGYAEGQKTKRLFIEQEHERFYSYVKRD